MSQIYKVEIELCLIKKISKQCSSSPDEGKTLVWPVLKKVVCIDICKQLKQEEKTKNLPVVLFSANVEMGKKIHECNASAYLSKPFATKGLLTIVEENACE